MLQQWYAVSLIVLQIFNDSVCYLGAVLGIYQPDLGEHVDMTGYRKFIHPFQQK